MKNRIKIFSQTGIAITLLSSLVMTGYAAEKNAIVAPMFDQMVKRQHSTTLNQRKIVAPMFDQIVKRQHSTALSKRKIVAPMFDQMVKRQHITAFGSR